MNDRRGNATLLADLERYVPANDREAAMALRLRDFVATHADCFERSLAIGHVTGSAWVVDRAGDAALLTHHRKLGKWLQLGGHADGDADVRRVARREALEESGLARVDFASDDIYDVDVHEIPARGAEAAHVHYDVRFAFFADRGDVPVASEESYAVAWVPFAEIERFTIDDSVRRLVAKTPSLVAARAMRSTSAT
jgi:8-oxo-dGTP pyrophosphatase MutT (NUDIX family)